MVSDLDVQETIGISWAGNSFIASLFKSELGHLDLDISKHLFVSHLVPWRRRRLG